MGIAGKKKATDLITEVFSYIRQIEASGAEATMSGRLAGRLMVEMYRVLTGEMPQSPGIEIEYHADELPGVELSSPVERDPSIVRTVMPQRLRGEPDVIWEEGGHEEKEGRSRGCLDGARAYPRAKGLQPPGKGKT